MSSSSGSVHKGAASLIYIFFVIIVLEALSVKRYLTSPDFSKFLTNVPQFARTSYSYYIYYKETTNTDLI